MDATPMLDDDAVLFSDDDNAADRPLLVLLHGYASDERDLFSLAAHLPTAYRMAAVRAPLAPPWPSPGYSWYPIEGLNGRDTAAMTAGADALIAWLDRTSTAESVGLLGFSQGGAISLQALRRQPDRFAFAVNLSGYAAPGELDTDAALAALRPPVFWGRGSADDVIPAPLITHTAQWLPDHVDLTGRLYPGLGHSVSAEELIDIRAFLERQLG